MPAITAKLLSIFKSKPIILTVHGTRLFENNLQLTPSRILEKIILTKITYNTQISVTKAFLKISNVNKRIVNITNGVDDDFPKISANKASYPKILWVGRFDTIKRVNDLIEAMKLIVDKLPTAKLVLVGYGYEEQKLKKLTRDLLLDDNVSFIGKQGGKRLINEYKRSHVFVLPSLSEGQPLTVLEALVAGLPIVATNVGGIPEVVKDGKNGLLIAPNNREALADAILQVLKNPQKYSQNTPKSDYRKYSWDVISNETKKVYLDLMM